MRGYIKQVKTSTSFAAILLALGWQIGHQRNELERAEGPAKPLSLALSLGSASSGAEIEYWDLRNNEDVLKTGSPLLEVFGKAAGTSKSSAGTPKQKTGGWTFPRGGHARSDINSKALLPRKQEKKKSVPPGRFVDPNENESTDLLIRVDIAGVGPYEYLFTRTKFEDPEIGGQSHPGFNVRWYPEGWTSNNVPGAAFSDSPASFPEPGEGSESHPSTQDPVNARLAGTAGDPQWFFPVSGQPTPQDYLAPKLPKFEPGASAAEVKDQLSDIAHRLLLDVKRPQDVYSYIATYRKDQQRVLIPVLGMSLDPGWGMGVMWLLLIVQSFLIYYGLAHLTPGDPQKLQDALSEEPFPLLVAIPSGINVGNAVTLAVGKFLSAILLLICLWSPFVMLGLYVFGHVDVPIIDDPRYPQWLAWPLFVMLLFFACTPGIAGTYYLFRGGGRRFKTWVATAILRRPADVKSV